MAYCQRCGEYCQDHYTYCKRCYFELGQPFGKAIERPHKCRKCGCTIYGRYNYCLSCAQKKVLLINQIIKIIKRLSFEDWR